ncbi:fasciclin domain-containing protein [Balneolaceae bacterium YR4-1]|uniref:Fasciclin domain-containing protein n=1 Tax=Halalkalibaculum roseum TaxID=2709311 RepID=A0A6M1SVQ0_9BACT|nr:fasciclin domain-containing protein [Halalkalibaculum roseum]NGP76188.1 fasciclin domain-containing protein [Halalkalibaculum roseum]
MKSATTYLAVIALSVALFAFTSTAKAQDNSSDIVDLAVQTESLSTLVQAVKAAGLVETLKGEGPYTVFAPTNEAFSKLPDGTLETLLKPENKDQLVRILTYHVVPGNVQSTDLEDGMTATTAEGSEIEVNLGETVMINNATVVNADIEASNGVVHVIDTVIMPPKKESSGSY